MGAVVVPGLMDAHAHFVGFADGLGAADLWGHTSADEVLDKVLAHAALFPEGWVDRQGMGPKRLGGDWISPTGADRLDGCFLTVR